MEQLEQKCNALEARVDELTHSFNKVKKIFYWIVWVSIALFVLPLIGLIFVIPQFLSTYGDMSGL